MTNNSVILSTGARYMLPIILMFSVFLLLRGHYEPGGGFIGGLAASAGFALFMIAYGIDKARDVLRIDTMVLIGAGLLIAVSSGLFSLLQDQPFMTGLWLPFEIPALGALGTPLLFDLGVYLVVIGVVLTIMFSLAEER